VKQKNINKEINELRMKIDSHSGKKFGGYSLVPSYYCLYSLFNKIRDKGKIVSAW
jgi:hypothetical protein